jgi:hypothetical protein
VHARSHVPALIAHYLWRRHQVPFVFDLRGRMADEYADAGIWPADGWMYRQVEQWEATFVKEAAGTVVLTDRFGASSTNARLAWPSFPARWTSRASSRGPRRPPAVRPRLRRLVVGLYLADEVLRFFVRLRELRPSSRLLLLVPRAAELRDLPPAWRRGPRGRKRCPRFWSPRAPAYRCAGPAGAQVAASPVKISEYFACGLPVLTSAGVGDLDSWSRSGASVSSSAVSGRGRCGKARPPWITLLDDPDVGAPLPGRGGGALRARIRRRRLRPDVSSILGTD